MVEELRKKLPELIDLCKEHSVARLDVFGSAAHGLFDPNQSDFDFLVVFGPVERRGFSDVYFKLLSELEALFGREVHLVEERCQDDDFLKYANKSRESLYAA